MTPSLGAWGLSGDLRPLPGGHRNRVLRVGNYVLKTSRRSEAALQWLGDVQDVAATCGLDSPRLIRSAQGTLKVQGWTCEPFCDGVETSPSDIFPQITAFHLHVARLPQRPVFASASDLLTGTSGADIDLSVMPTDLVQRLRDAWSQLPTQQVTVHADLNPSNILRDVHGAVTLIDWDEARRDASIFDLGDVTEPARLAWEIACCWQIEPEHARALASSLPCVDGSCLARFF
ncbi:phosphotransferase [Tateyamaria pelophila]|uniref:phosphotransferase n=1 Tax=Tateyamaria pelophila TaxID=328415 RepID=UPI001CC16308|nr:phosphotransferase [Tateyamaria pelophila]